MPAAIDEAAKQLERFVTLNPDSAVGTFWYLVGLHFSRSSQVIFAMQGDNPTTSPFFLFAPALAELTLRRCPSRSAGSRSGRN